jgi:ubiquinone/menaquinone biosynthesis C-methylase UbiE
MSIQNAPRRILDLCTGTGVATFIASQVFPEAKIVAVDQSEGMLKIAQAKADKTGLSSIEFKLGNVMQLAEPDASFDMVISSNAPVYLSEIARVLTPGGIFMTAFFFGGLSFVKLEKEISALLGKHGLRLLALQSVGEGVYILSEKA